MEFYETEVALFAIYITFAKECKFFDKPWHFHKEYELVLIDNNEGTRFIGDQVSHFKDGDLVLQGPNIPHLYRNSDGYYQKNTLAAKSIFMHFTEDFLGESFFNIPEMRLVKRLLNRSSLGLDIFGKSNEWVRQKMIGMKNESPSRRLLTLLDILEFLSTSKDIKPILSNGFTAKDSYDTDRIDIVLQFIMENYSSDIYIEKIASKLNMSVPSFSRYFKHHTKKTFSNYVTEIRISHACRLLLEDNYNISEICYQSGFDTLSNYYRHFKKYVGIIPKEYKKRFLLNT